MYVCRLKIEGFRGIKSADVRLSHHSVLVGANNAGKTSIIDALNLVLGRGSLRKELFEYDFYGGSPTPSSRVKIEATITGFNSNNPEDHPSVFNFEKGGIPVWWDNETGETTTSEKPGTSLAVEVGFAARFDDELLEEQYKSYFVEGEGDPFLEDNLNSVSWEFLREVGLFLVPARRTWEALWSFKSNLFRQVLASQDAMPGAAVKSLRDSLRSPDVRLEESGSFSGVVGRLNRELEAFIQPHTSEVSFRPTAGDTPAVLDSIVPHVRARSGDHLPLRQHGSGVVSLQWLLLLMEFGRRRMDAGENFLLTAEEPELHLHPGQHRRLVARMRGIANQTIVTTHSPQVASFYRLEEILAVHCDSEGHLRAQPLIEQGGPPEQMALMKLFTLYRAEVCEAVMADVVVLPEGITDFRWLRGLAQESVTAEGWSLAAVEDAAAPLGVLPTQNAHVKQTFDLLSGSVANLLPLVDGDGGGDDHCRALVKLANPPAAVVQLQKGWTVEDVVSWILLADGDAFSDVREVLGRPSLKPAELADELRDSYKTKWDQHELLASLVGTSQARATRVRGFLKGLSDIGSANSSEAPGFAIDEERSTDATSVWVFSPEVE